MKKNLRKTLTKATAVAMVLAMVASVTPANSADAKAKKPKFAKKTVKVVVKKTKKVKLKNTKKIKKTKWSVQNKKIVKLSKKKKTSVTVKGLKAGKKTKVTAKVTLKGKKKPLKLKLTVKVTKKTTPSTKPGKTPTTKPNTTASAGPSNSPGNQTSTPAAPTPDKINGVEVDADKTLSIPITELNETSITSDAKRSEKDQEAGHAGAEFGKDGMTFTTKESYNSGAMFYLDPITSEDDLTDAAEGNNQGGRVVKVPKEGKGGKVDIADYDYIRVTMKSAYEINMRLYDDLDQFLVDGAGFPGTAVSLYGNADGVIHPSAYTTKEPIAPGESSTANHYFADEAKTKDLTTAAFTWPVKTIVKTSQKSSFCGVAVCGQFKDQEYVISKIELLKVKDSVPASKPVSVKVTPEEDKAAILNGATLQFSAEVLNKNESVMPDEQVTWSITGDAATISETGLLTADDSKTGKVTVTATSKTDATVKGTYEVEICDETALMSIAFTNKYTTYTLDEVKDGIDIAPKGLNGAGEPVKEQPEITVEESEASDGISYKDGKLTGTKAGTITLKATSGKMSAEVTIAVVDGMRVELTADNTGSVPVDYSTSEVSNGVLTCTQTDWNVGGYVKVETGDKKVANIAGILWTLQIPDAKSCDQKPTVSVRYGDLTKPSQAINYGLDSVIWEGEEYTAEDYAEGVDLKSDIDWNFCYKDGADVEIDTTGTVANFTFGKNGPAGQVQKISNVIVLWGDEPKMPELKEITVTEGQNQTSVPLNRKLNLKQQRSTKMTKQRR